MTKLIERLARPQVFWPVMVLFIVGGVFSMVEGWERHRRDANEFMISCTAGVENCRALCVQEFYRQRDGTVRYCENWGKDD